MQVGRIWMKTLANTEGHDGKRSFVIVAFLTHKKNKKRMRGRTGNEKTAISDQRESSSLSSYDERGGRATTCSF